MTIAPMGFLSVASEIDCFHHKLKAIAILGQANCPYAPGGKQMYTLEQVQDAKKSLLKLLIAHLRDKPDAHQA